MSQTEHTITLRVKLCDDVAKKYPNYKLNFASKEEFLEFIAYSLHATHDGTTIEDMLNDFGYAITDHKVEPIKT